MLKSAALLNHSQPKGLVLTYDCDSLQYLLLLVQRVRIRVTAPKIDQTHSLMSRIERLNISIHMDFTNLNQSEYTIMLSKYNEVLEKVTFRDCLIGKINYA